MLVLNTCLITAQSLNSNSFLSIIQEFRRDRRVGHENTNHNSPNTTQSTNDDEFVSPRCQSTFDVADTITKETS